MRNLNSRSYEVLGVDQKVWLSLETGGFGEDATGGLVPVSGGAVESITANIKFDIPREDSAARSGRSVVTRLSGKKEVEFSYEGYIIPGIPNGSGNPTLPPIHPLLLSAFGEVDTDTPSEIVYRLSRLNAASFRMLEEATHYSRLGVGCVCDKITFNLPGDGKAQVSAEGFGQDVFVGGETKLAQAAGVAATATMVKQDLTFTAIPAGSAGNLISIDYITGGTAGSETVGVNGNAITVEIDDTVSTATQIKAAIDGTPAAAALVTIAISGVAGNGQTITGAAQYLSGGLLTTELKVTAGHGIRFEAGAYIDTIAVSDGNTTSNSAKRVVTVGTGVNADVLTFGAALTPAALGDYIIGHAPATFAPVSSENALLGLKGSVTVGGGVLPCEVISAEISITNNYTKKDFVYGTSRICGYIPDKRREVKCTLEVILNRDNFGLFMQTKQFIAQDVTITLDPQDIPAPAFTSPVGRRWTWHLPRVEFNIPAIEQPADAYVQLSLEGVAMAVDANTLDSEVTLTIN